MEKRGQLDVQFSWIFILIAGAIILGLFFKVAYMQRQISLDKASVRLQNDFDTITSSALRRKDTLHTIDLPRVGLHFSCEDCDCNILFGRFGLPYGDRVIFSPSAVEGSAVKLWVLDWKVPFRTTNVLYVTNDRTHYFIMGSGDMKAKFERQLPDGIKSQVTFAANYNDPNSPIINNNFDRAVFVFLNRPYLPLPQTLSKREFKGVDVSYVSLYDNGKIEFIGQERGSPKYESAYLGDELMFGAMIAQDREAYDCNVKTAFTRLEGVSQVYQERVREINGVGSHPCSYIYSRLLTADSPLSIMVVTAKKIRQEGIDAQKKSRIATAIDELAVLNERLLRQSCPTVY